MADQTKKRGIYALDSIMNALKRYIEETGGAIYTPRKRFEEIARVMTIDRKTLYSLRKRGYIDLPSARVCTTTANGRLVWFYDAKRLLHMLDTFKRLGAPAFPPK